METWSINFSLSKQNLILTNQLDAWSGSERKWDTFISVLLEVSILNMNECVSFI